MYKTRIETFENILSPMLECFDNNDYKIEYYNKLQGYGLKASDFEKYEGCSRRVFSHWKNFLLDQKLIRAPKVKRRQKKDTSKRSSKNLPYIITPLGICYFSSILDKIDLHHGEKIVRFLSNYSSYNLHIDWKKICEIIGSKEAHHILKKVCDSIDIIDINDEIKVILSYKSRGKISYEFFKYIINHRQISLQLLEDQYTIESFTNLNPVSTPIIDDNLFHRDMAEFIVESFCYSIIENCHWKILNKSRLLSWEETTSKEKSKIKNTITKYEKILENIPFEVHLIANNFIGQNFFGTIKQEQQLVKEAYGYFYSKIVPKYGFEFEDKDENPSQLFSSD